MDNQTRTSFEQWDRQEAARLHRQAQDQAYIQLNNLYLSIERGEVRLSVRRANDLRVLVGQAYEQGDPMADYWAAEFMQLPRWLDF